MTAVPATVPATAVPASLVPDLHPLQMGRGIVQFYKAFARAEQAYRIVNGVLQGKRQMPILQCSTGDDVLEFDINAFVKHIKDESERLGVLEKMLTPWNNYLVAQYFATIRKLDEFCKDLYKQLAGAVFEVPDTFVQESFETCIAGIHEWYKNFEPCWIPLETAYQAAEQLVDPELSIQGLASGNGVMLSDLLKLAGVDNEEITVRVSQALIQVQLEATKGNLQPCLRLLTANTDWAVRAAALQAKAEALRAQRA